MGELTPQQVQQLVRKEVTNATASRVSREHVRLLKVTPASDSALPQLMTKEVLS